MEDLLISTLETFGFPVMLQGALLPNEPYPADFFTFWKYQYGWMDVTWRSVF